MCVALSTFYRVIAKDHEVHNKICSMQTNCYETSAIVIIFLVIQLYKPKLIILYLFYSILT